jgi:serine/threonine-protein kinase RsbW
MLVRMELTLPRDARYVAMMRNVAVCVLQDLDVPQEAIGDVQVAVTEACANAVRHAVGSAEYTVGLAVAADGCEIEIIDVGPGFDPLGAELDEFDPDAEDGRGLYLMRALVDDLAYDRVDNRTRVTLTKRWPHRHIGIAALDGDHTPEAPPERAGSPGGQRGPVQP